MFTFEKLIYRERVNQRSDGQTETEKKAREEPTTTNDFNVLQMLLLVVSCLLHFIEFTSLCSTVSYRTAQHSATQPSSLSACVSPRPKEDYFVLFMFVALHFMLNVGERINQTDYRLTENGTDRQEKGGSFLDVVFCVALLPLRCNLWKSDYSRDKNKILIELHEKHILFSSDFFFLTPLFSFRIQGRFFTSFPELTI